MLSKSHNNTKNYLIFDNETDKLFSCSLALFSDELMCAICTGNRFLLLYIWVCFSIGIVVDGKFMLWIFMFYSRFTKLLLVELITIEWIAAVSESRVESIQMRKVFSELSTHCVRCVSWLNLNQYPRFSCGIEFNA